MNMYQKLFTLQEDIFKVLASQKRLEIIQLLDNRELSVTEMIEMLGLPQANLSQHLTQLRQAKIILSRRDGHTIYYRLGDSRISKACDLIKDVLRDGYNLSIEDSLVGNDYESLYPIVKDVVCGMRISVARAGGSDVYNEKQYYFCASGCREMFHSHPQKYVKKEMVRG